MADAATLGEALFAADCGFDLVAATLSGHTRETRGQPAPDFGLVAQIAAGIPVSVVCEGGVAPPREMERMLDSLIRSLKAKIALKP